MGIKTKIIGGFNKLKFATKAKSPEILLVSGFVAGAACLFFACKGTLKAKTIVDESKEEALTLPKTTSTKKHAAKTSLKVVRAYAPAIGFGMVSAGCILASYKILDRRLVGATAAYESLNALFKRYRKRVAEKYGEEADAELYYGDKMKKKTIVDENGEVIDIDELEPDMEKGVPWETRYAIKLNEPGQRFIDRYELACLQNYWNDKLDREGYVLYNDIRKEFNYPIDGDAVGVGWISQRMIDKLGLTGKYHGDGFISFGVFDKLVSEQAKAYVNGLSRTVTIDFNVDGPIYKLINAINSHQYLDPDYLCDTDAAKSIGGAPGIVTGVTWSRFSDDKLRKDGWVPGRSRRPGTVDDL